MGNIDQKHIKKEPIRKELMIKNNFGLRETNVEIEKS